jgi:hypothetical protein
MGEQKYVVKAGDSPERLEKQFGVSWITIKAHPANAFLRTRKGYPIRPGDTLVVPPAGENEKELARRFQEFLRMVAANIRALSILTQEHPARDTATVHSITLPKVDPDVKATHAAAVVGYKKPVTGVWASVTLTASIERAFEALKPTLPPGVVMTSGYRSDADQERTINNYFASHSGPSTITDVEARRQWLQSEKGLIIARVGRSPHRTGLAFDLSGADLDSMNAAVKNCAQTNEMTFPLLSTIVERKQNCLHVNLKY